MKRVIKIGGSLLKAPRIDQIFDRWNRHHSTTPSLAIVGGGDLVNAIREIDAISSLNTTEIHWLCVELLGHTFQLLKQRLDWPVIESSDELARWTKEPREFAQTTLVRVDTFYNQQSTSGRDDLPENWDTTTDSIAAMLAKRVNAEELIILKSCDIPEFDSLSDLASQGIVDHAFPEASRGIKKIVIEKLEH